MLILQKLAFECRGWETSSAVSLCRSSFCDGQSSQQLPKALSFTPFAPRSNRWCPTSLRASQLRSRPADASLQPERSDEDASFGADLPQGSECQHTGDFGLEKRRLSSGFGLGTWTLRPRKSTGTVTVVLEGAALGIKPSLIRSMHTAPISSNRPLTLQPLESQRSP